MEIRDNQPLEARETTDLIGSDKVEGTAVFNRQGERLGRVERFMVEKSSGKARYAVLSFGGLFGIGDNHYPLPWDALTYDTAQGGYVVDVSRDQIEGAPSYDGAEPAYDQDYNQRVFSYYGYPYG